MYASEIVNEVMFQVDEEGTKIAASADTNLEENLPTDIPDDNHDTNGHGVVDYFNSFFYKPEKKLDDCYPWCGISPNVSKGYHEIIANKPFLFMIYRHKVGPLFVGKYVHPRSN